MKKVGSCFLVGLLAAASALNYAVFIFPNSFAPSGLDGICTMIQYLSHISMGYMSLLANIPLLILSFIFLGRAFSIKTTVYVVCFSATTIFLRHVDLSMIVYHTNSQTSIVLAPVAAGVIRGLLYVLTLRENATSGGTDIAAALIRLKKPHLPIMTVVFALNATVALCAYFVYGFKAEPVICSILYAFITTSVCQSVQHARQDRVRFEIVTSCADDQRFVNAIKRSSTILTEQKTDQEKKLIVCVAEKHEAEKLEDLLHTLPDTVFYCSSVTG